MKHAKTEAYGYRPAYIKTMNRDGEDSNCVGTPALHTGFSVSDGPPPTDPHLDRLIKQFRAGKLPCRKAVVAMFWIRPYSDFRPHITEKYRQYIDYMNQWGSNYNKGPIPIVLYEHNGQLIMSGDYRTYWVHRSDESWNVDCIILGNFTERDFCRGVGDPFSVDSLDLSAKDELMDSGTRRIALLLRGEPVRIEAREEREAINKKDFEDALNEPVEYEPDWTHTLNKYGEDPNLVCTPPLHEGYFFGPPPEDTRYTELSVKAQSGMLDCQLATVTMAMMRPYSDFKPVISGEIRNEFNRVSEDIGELPITVYEYEPGHFMVSGGNDNYAVYTLYREKQLLYGTCIILGLYTKTWAVGSYDKPFRVTLSPQSGYEPENTPFLLANCIYTRMMDKGLYLEKLACLTGIDHTELDKITDRDDPKLPTIEQLERIARVLGVQASDLLPF
jgi:DNA-binding Xre family transcriptional regulator